MTLCAPETTPRDPKAGDPLPDAPCRRCARVTASYAELDSILAHASVCRRCGSRKGAVPLALPVRGLREGSLTPEGLLCSAAVYVPCEAREALRVVSARRQGLPVGWQALSAVE